MKRSGFKKVGKSEKKMYGPTGALVCGFGMEERERFMDMLEKKGIALPVFFAATDDGRMTLKSLFAKPAGTGINEDSRMPRAVILSGITENQLHDILSLYRETGLPQTMWATLTPVSENWTLFDLLAELEKEAVAMKKR